MEKFNPERLGEIAWLLVKWKLSKNGIPLGNFLSREAGNLTQALHVPLRLIMCFFKEAYAELHNANFPDNDYQICPVNDYEPMLIKIRNQVAFEYILFKAKEESALMLNKERLHKTIAEFSIYAGIDEAEARPFFGEISLFLFREEMKIPKDEK